MASTGTQSTYVTYEPFVIGSPRGRNVYPSAVFITSAIRNACVNASTLMSEKSVGWAMA